MAFITTTSSNDTVPYNTRHFEQSREIFLIIQPAKSELYDARPTAYLKSACKTMALFLSRPSSSLSNMQFS